MLKSGSGIIARLAALTVLLASTVAPAATLTQTVAFESECLDLDTGELATSCRERVMEEGGDVVWDAAVGYHADRNVHAVVLPNPAAGSEVALLAGRTFDDVTAADAEAATFVADVLDEPFDLGAVVLVRTDRGAVYKLGRPLEDAMGVTFDYELLVPAP